MRIVYTLLLMALLSSCGTEKSTDKSIFRLNLDQGVTSLDPAFARSQNNTWCINMLFNSLVQLDSTLQTQPCIAKSWMISEDGLTYTFILRKDVRFHPSPLFQDTNGRTVVAADAVYTFSRLIDPKTASSGSWIFNDKVSGPNAFQAIDDTTFCVQLTKPFPAFLGLLATQYCAIVPKEVVQHYGKDFRNHPIGTGPFVFNYWKEGEVMAFVKNSVYFEKDAESTRLPYLDAVKITFVTDKQTAFLEFLKKKLDFFVGIDGSYRNDVLTKQGTLQSKYKGRFELLISPYLNTEYLGILVDTNISIVQKSPLKLQKVRQAINYAIDRKKMVRYLQNGIGIPAANGFIPKGLPGFAKDTTIGYIYDPEKAKRLLAEAGFDSGKAVPEITLRTSTTYRDLVEFVQKQLQDIGLTCKIEVQPMASLREIMVKQQVNFFRGSWIADYPDAENYLAVFYSKNFTPTGPNYTHFKNEEFDRLFEQSYFERNDSLRYRLYERMDRIVMEQAPIVVLYYDESVRLAQNNIKGLSQNPMNLLSLKTVRKEN